MDTDLGFSNFEETLFRTAASQKRNEMGLKFTLELSDTQEASIIDAGNTAVTAYRRNRAAMRGNSNLSSPVPFG